MGTYLALIHTRHLGWIPQLLVLDQLAAVRNESHEDSMAVVVNGLRGREDDSVEISLLKMRSQGQPSQNPSP